MNADNNWFYRCLSAFIGGDNVLASTRKELILIPDLKSLECLDPPAEGHTTT
jgi:hypothetical protein